MFFIIKYLFIALTILYSDLYSDNIQIGKSDSNNFYGLDSIKFYIIKDEWHTAFLFEINDSLIKQIPALEDFNNFNFVDIGWGDEEFFQNPNDDIYLGAKAILYPTPSVVRIAGMITKLASILRWVDYCVEVNVSNVQFHKLCQFINGSFEKDENKNLIKTSKRPSGAVIFYKSNLKYHLFNTCNTWIGEGLESIGFDIDTGGLITADQLLEELIEVGTVLKFE
jgi:acyl carrier protein